MSYQDELNKLMEQFKHTCFGYAQNQDPHTSRRMAEAKQAVEQLVAKMVPAVSNTRGSFLEGWDCCEKVLLARAAKSLDFDAEREDFEAFSTSIGRVQLERRNDGYQYGLTNEAWMAWKACGQRKVLRALIEKLRAQDNESPVTMSVLADLQLLASRGQAVSYTMMEDAAHRLSEGPNGKMSDAIRTYLEGMSISVDVSTSEADAGNRLFGTITEVMDHADGKHGVILLMQDGEPNYEVFTTLPYMELCDWIKAARTKSGLTLEGLGDLVGRTKANVHGWEKGLHEPSFEQVLKIAEVTKIALPIPLNMLPNFEASDEAFDVTDVTVGLTSSDDEDEEGLDGLEASAGFKFFDPKTDEPPISSAMSFILTQLLIEHHDMQERINQPKCK